MKTILRFTASWCMPCKSMSLQLENLNTGIQIEVIDIDVYPDIAIEYGIRSVPTLVMLEDKKIIKRITGVKTPLELKEWINE